MIISAPQPSVVHLFSIFRQIAAGELRIPAFQREFVWRDKQVIELLNSVRQQFPIGSILLWNTDRKMLEIAGNQVTSFPDVPESFPTNYILDGMQRLTTLYGTFHYEVGDDAAFNVFYDLRRKKFLHEYDLSLVDYPAAIPLSSLLSPRRLLEHQARFAEQLDGDDLLDELLETQATFQDYMIPIVKIQGTDIDRIVEIFERTNSTGTRLDTVDFMRAITWNQNFDLNRSLDAVSATLSEGGFELGDETVIKCVGLMLGASPSADGLLSLRNRSPHDLDIAFQRFPDLFRSVTRFLHDLFQIEDRSFVPYEGQLLVLFKAIGMGEANASEHENLKSWFWATGFNEALRGKPDHYVVRAVENWRALIAGQIRGLEPRLRLSDADFMDRRIIKGKALSGAFAAMFAQSGAASLLSSEVIPTALYMSVSDLDSFVTVLSAKTLKESGIDVGASARIFSNIILAHPLEVEIPGPSNWVEHIVRLHRAGAMGILETQFIDQKAAVALQEGDFTTFLRQRASLMRAKAAGLVG